MCLMFGDHPKISRNLEVCAQRAIISVVYNIPGPVGKLFWRQSFFWWFRNPANSPVEVGSWNPIFYDGFGIHPRWLGMGFLNHQQYSSDDRMFSWLKITSERNTTSKDNVSPFEITNFTIHLHLPFRRWCDFYIAWRKRWVVAIVFKLIGRYLLQSWPSIFSSPHL